MKNVILNEYEQEYLKNYVSGRINFIKEVLKHCEFSSYDHAENEYRKRLEMLIELEKKLSNS